MCGNLIPISKSGFEKIFMAQKIFVFRISSVVFKLKYFLFLALKAFPLQNNVSNLNYSLYTNSRNGRRLFDNSNKNVGKKKG